MNDTSAAISNYIPANLAGAGDYPVFHGTPRRVYLVEQHFSADACPILIRQAACDDDANFPGGRGIRKMKLLF